MKHVAEDIDSVWEKRNVAVATVAKKLACFMWVGDDNEKYQYAEGSLILL